MHHQRWYYVDNKVVSNDFLTTTKGIINDLASSALGSLEERVGCIQDIPGTYCLTLCFFFVRCLVQARDKVGNALRDAIKQRMPQTGKSNDCMSAFSLESSFFWNDRTPAPQLAGVENPLVDEPSDASNLRIDQPRSYSSNLELPHVPSMAALQIGSGASLGFAFPINARTHPVVPHRSLFTNNLAQWETLDLMDLEPRPLGLLPHEASSMLLSESSMGPGASNVARSPPWCKAMLSGSQINPLDVEKRSSSGSSSDEEEPRWYKSQQT